MYTTAEVLQIANVCQFLAADDEAQQAVLFSGFERPRLSRLIYIVKSGVAWLNAYNPSSSSLYGQTTYLFSLCQPYVGRALIILGTAGTGQIVNPSTGLISTIRGILLEFQVGVTSSPQVVNGVPVTLPTNGQTTIVMNLPNVLSNTIAVAKDGVVLPIGATDRLSYTAIYTLFSVTITIGPSGASFQNGDLFIISGLQYVAI